MNAVFGFRSEEPLQCGLCSRATGYVGCMEKSGDLVLWLCELCNAKAGLKVIDMKPDKLEEIEAIGLSKAAGETATELLPAVLSALWDEGIRSLEEIDPERLRKATTTLTESREYAGAVRKLLLSYSATMRFEVAKAKA